MVNTQKLSDVTFVTFESIIIWRYSIDTLLYAHMSSIHDPAKTK